MISHQCVGKHVTSKCQPYFLNKNNICMKKAFLLREWGNAFSEYFFVWITFYTLDNWTSCPHGSAYDSTVRRWLQMTLVTSHKNFPLSSGPLNSPLDLLKVNEGIVLALQWATLTTFPFARIRVFCNFTSWLWMINLLVLGWESPNHQNKWENDFLLDIFYCWQWFWYSQLEKLTHIQIASSQSQKPCSIPLHQDL